MTEIPKFLREHLESNIIGRIKLRLYETISGKKNHAPDEKDIKKYVRQKLRFNHEIGRFVIHLLSTKTLDSIQFSNLQEPNDKNALLLDLEKNFLSEILFLELTDCPIPFPKSMGVCVYCEKLLPKGYLYIVEIFDEQFPEYVIGQMEVRASKDCSEPMFLERQPSHDKIYNKRNYKKSIFAVLALKILNCISKNRKPKLVSISEATNPAINFKEYSVHRPPIDKIQFLLIQMVAVNKVSCTRTKVPLSNIKPHNLDFCINYPKATIKEIIEDIKNGDESPLLVYWNGNCFIMSDDYAQYLAYKTLNFDEVPVVITGRFPLNMVSKPMKVGGAELFPPLRIEWSADYSSLSDELQNLVLEQKLSHKEQSETVSNLYYLFIELSYLVSNNSVKERQIHNFIFDNPNTFDIYGSQIMSEVWLGNKYRIDLVIQYKLDEKNLLFIELERANLNIFTKKGELRSSVNHAINQVEDWLRWWDENPNDRPKAFDSFVKPQGLVVIGRNINFNEADKTRLISLNSNRHVKVITYDDLLDKIESLIENLEAA